MNNIFTPRILWTSKGKRMIKILFFVIISTVSLSCLLFWMAFTKNHLRLLPCQIEVKHGPIVPVKLYNGPKCEYRKNSPPLILGWTTIIGSDPTHELSSYGLCPVKCEYSSEKGREDEAAMLVFHYREDKSNLNLPKRRHVCQLYAVWLFESALSTWPLFPNDFFNVSITYRMEEDGTNIAYPHGILIPRPADGQIEEKDHDLIWTKEEIQEKVAKKRAMVLWVASNCEANSGRELYAKELQKHIHVEIFGKCGERRINNTEYTQQMESHYFYLSFENTICRHYITEKFWLPLTSLTVPIVLSREPFRGRNIPDEAFIPAEDFGSPRELAEFLRKIVEDKSRYIRYFDWTNNWLALTYGQWTGKSYANSSLPGLPLHPYCRLCQMAYGLSKGHRHQSLDFAHFWWTQGQCTDKFVKSRKLLPPFGNAADDS